MKPIILMVNGDTLELKTKSRLVKGCVSQYALYFSGIDKRLYNIAHLESITKEAYVPCDSKGVCVIPDCFDVCDEIKVSLTTVSAHSETKTEPCFLYFK